LFYAFKQQKWLFIVYTFNTVIYALVLLCAIAAADIVGAAWTTLFYAVLSASTQMVVLRKLASQTIVDPRSVFKIEGFDRRLWEILQARVLRCFKNSGEGS